MAKENLIQAVGKRKNAVARVYLRKPKGEKGVIQVNGRKFEEYFPRESSRCMIVQPIELTRSEGQYDIFINVFGGGLSGQAGAVKHGIARSLQLLDPQLRPSLKRAGHLTRDAREVERKKYGQPGARKKFQFSKR